MTITARLRGAGDGAAYDAFLADHPRAMLYYTQAYGAFLQTLLGCEDHTVLAVEGDAIVGILPLMRAQGPDGFVYNSLPFYGSHGGVLATSDAGRTALLDHFGQIASAPDTAAAMMVENPFVRDTTALPDHGCACFTDGRISQMTPLLAEAELLASLDGSARRNIRKAAKNGVTVAVENDQFDFLHQTHVANMAAMGGNAKTPAFFDAVQDRFTAGTDYTLHVARHEGTPVAALLTLYGHGVAEYFTPVTLAEARPLEPMAAILYAAMVQAQAAGHRWWNWGGTWDTQDGVYRFKKKWGAQERRYGYHIRVRNRDLLTRTPEYLLQHYPGFYTVPFDQLGSTS